MTGRSLLWSNLLSEPLFTLYGLISFILYKDLGASAFLISLVTMLKAGCHNLFFLLAPWSLRSSSSLGRLFHAGSLFALPLGRSRLVFGGGCCQLYVFLSSCDPRLGRNVEAGNAKGERSGFFFELCFGLCGRGRSFSGDGGFLI